MKNYKSKWQEASPPRHEGLSSLERRVPWAAGRLLGRGSARPAPEGHVTAAREQRGHCPAPPPRAHACSQDGHRHGSVPKGHPVPPGHGVGVQGSPGGTPLAVLPRDWCSSEVTAPPEQFWARLLQALLSPARSSRQSRGPFPAHAAPASASPDPGMQRCGKPCILSLCVRIYIKRG